MPHWSDSVKTTRSASGQKLVELTGPQCIEVVSKTKCRWAGGTPRLDNSGEYIPAGNLDTYWVSELDFINYRLSIMDPVKQPKLVLESGLSVAPGTWGGLIQKTVERIEDKKNPIIEFNDTVAKAASTLIESMKKQIAERDERIRKIDERLKEMEKKVPAAIALVKGMLMISRWVTDERENLDLYKEPVKAGSMAVSTPRIPATRKTEEGIVSANREDLLELL